MLDSRVYERELNFDLFNFKADIDQQITSIDKSYNPWLKLFLRVGDYSTYVMFLFDQ